MKLSSGHTAEELEGEELKRMQQDFADITGLVRIQPGRWLYPKGYAHFADKIYNFQWNPSDVCIMTYPKCGTTWTQEIIWTMRNNPNLDNPMHSAPIFARSPFLEIDMLMASGPQDTDPNNPMLKQFHKLCPGKDIKDGLMIQIAVLFGAYWMILKEAWEKRFHPNMHIMYFEDMKADIKKEILKLDCFIGTGLTDKQIDNVIEWTSFKSMKERGVHDVSKGANQDVLKKDGGFMRKGITGDWKGKYTPELEALVDNWTQKHLGDLGVKFKYEM